jgi:hypothetical protein
MTRPGHHEVDPHRRQTDEPADDDRTPTRGPRPQQPAGDEPDGDGEIGPERQRQPGEPAGDVPRTALPGAVEVDPAQHEHRRPQRQGETAVPRHRRQRDRREDVEDRQRADDRGGRASPRPGQREQGEDDAEVLQQPERALGRQRVPDDLVPAEQRVQ